MADQPKAMTLREAVEIVDVGRFDYCHPRGPDWDSDESRGARWDRARAIVDAAVQAHEARLALEAFPGDPADTGFDWHTEPLWEASKNADDKLRALERGEETKP